MPKNKKEHKMSERKKYLRTLMADMGLERLEELSESERRRWLRAAEPSLIVKKRLKEKGYSLNKDNNKLSLGRLNNLIKINKIASSDFSAEINIIKSYMDQNSYRKIVRKILPLEVFTGKKKDFNKDKYIREALASIKNKSNNQIDEAKIKSTLDSLYEKLNIIFLANMNLDVAFERNPSLKLSVSSMNKKQKNEIKSMLYLSKYIGKDMGSIGDEEITSILKRIQEENNLNPDGILDRNTYNALSSKRNRPAQSRESVAKTNEDPEPISTSSFDRSAVQSINIRKNVKMDETSDALKKFVMILDRIATNFGIKFTITSAYRSWNDQARVMYYNYSKKGVGTEDAANYLINLYGKKILPIVDVYAAKISDANKIKRVEAILREQWKPKGHGKGLSIDVAGASRSQFDKILDEAEKYADFKRLWEDQVGNDHYHLTVKSIKSS